MAFMTWTDELVTGNVEIDTQHRYLVTLLNQLHDAMRIGKGNSVLSSIFDQLVTYTDEHFKTEERLFGPIDYPQKEAHLHEHLVYDHRGSRVP
jgi:hemerythrin-like metal-binding protein